MLEVVLTKGVDMAAVVHAGRTVTAHQRTAPEQRDPVCVVEGCGVGEHLEIDLPPRRRPRCLAVAGPRRRRDPPAAGKLTLDLANAGP